MSENVFSGEHASKGANSTRLFILVYPSQRAKRSLLCVGRIAPSRRPVSLPRAAAAKPPKSYASKVLWGRRALATLFPGCACACASRAGRGTRRSDGPCEERSGAEWMTRPCTCQRRCSADWARWYARYHAEPNPDDAAFTHGIATAKTPCAWPRCSGSLRIGGRVLVRGAAPALAKWGARGVLWPSDRPRPPSDTAAAGKKRAGVTRRQNMRPCTSTGAFICRWFHPDRGGGGACGRAQPARSYIYSEGSSTLRERTATRRRRGMSEARGAVPPGDRGRKRRAV